MVLSCCSYTLDHIRWVHLALLAISCLSTGLDGDHGNGVTVLFLHLGPCLPTTQGYWMAIVSHRACLASARYLAP